MKPYVLGMLTLLSLSILPAVGLGQHCAPIVESYLGNISLQREDDMLRLRCEYIKTGGQPKDAYQVYLLAHWETADHRLPGESKEKVFDEQRVAVLHTGIMTRNKQGHYVFEYQIGCQPFAERLDKLRRTMPAGRLSKEGEPAGEVTPRDPQVQLTLFVPFLDDRPYANLPGLPENRHECNYRDERALLLQKLPATVRLSEKSEGQFYVWLNSSRPSKKRDESAGKP